MSDLIATGWGWCFGGDNGYTATIYMSFGPINGVAQATLGTNFSPGYAAVGFPTYTFRPTPGGGDQPVSFPFDINFAWPPNVWDAHLSSVTADLGMAGGGVESGSYVVNVFAW